LTFALTQQINFFKQQYFFAERALQREGWRDVIQKFSRIQ